MRVSREQAERNRREVVGVASRLFRERGFDGVGIADIMKAAGLTHGGFYGQFRSKEHLAAEASGAALARSQAVWARVLAEASGGKLAALVRFYLADQHRGRIGAGCLMAALGPEVARSGNAVKAAFQEGLQGHLELLEDAMAERDGATAAGTSTRQEAIAALCTMVGALILSRAVEDLAIAGEILEAASDDLLHRESAGEPRPGRA